MQLDHFPETMKTLLFSRKMQQIQRSCASWVCVGLSNEDTKEADLCIDFPVEEHLGMWSYTASESFLFYR